MTILIEGMDELLKRITTIRQFRHVKAQFRKAGVVLKGYMARYPKVSRRKNWMLYGDSERAQRMRRGYFYHLKHGNIEVPYRRGQSPNSKKLGQSWTVSQPGDGFTTTVGTNVNYAPLVQGHGAQTSYHAHTGWLTEQSVIRLHSREVIEYIKQGIEEELAGKP